MAGVGKMAAAVGVAVVGIGAAVYSVWSLQRRPSSPPPPAPPGMAGAGPRRIAAGPGGGGVEVKLGPEAAQRLGITQEELDARVKELLATGVSPRDLGRELGLGDVPMEVTRRVEGVEGGEGGMGGARPELEPAPVGPFEFVRPDSAVESARLEGVMEAKVEEMGAGVEGVDVGRGDARNIARAARLALAAPARGRSAFAEAVRELGGVLGEDRGLTGSAVAIAGMMEGAALDPTKVRVKGVEAGVTDRMPMPRRAGEADGERPGGGFRMMMSIMRTRDGDAEGELATMTMPVGDVWPQTADEVEDEVIAVEARCPVRLKNLDVKDGDAEIGVVMVRERESRTWQPVRYVLYIRDSKAARGFARALGEAARARGGG